MNPRYSYPSKVILGLLRDLLLLNRRSFREDSRAIIAQLEPPLQILGEEFVPSTGPCVLTMNHYTRAGFHIWWAAFAISAVLPSSVHWVMTSEWTTPGKWFDPFKSAISRFASERIVQVYDFTSMPPMPPREKDVASRAASVRSVLSYADLNGNNAMIGLAPEGRDESNGKLMRPAPGVGRFCLLLAARHLRFVPVGVYESKGEFYLNFGEAYELKVCSSQPTPMKDRLAAEVVMRNISALLPGELRGEFNQLESFQNLHEGTRDDGVSESFGRSG